MAEIERFPVTRIHSLAVRNFRSINELQTYEFTDGLNTISGGNMDGKSAILNAIKIVLDPEIKHRCSSFWGFGFMGQTSLIEITFTANQKLHYLRRVISNDNTTDIHLYVGEKYSHFYRDGEASEYLMQIIPPSNSILNTPWQVRFGFIRSSDSMIDDERNYKFDQEELEFVNNLLDLVDTDVKKLYNKKLNTYCVFRDGSETKFQHLSSSEQLFFTLIGNISHNISRVGENKTKVVLIDDFDRALGKELKHYTCEILRVIARLHDLQIIVTSRHRIADSNNVRIPSKRIPSVYNSVVSNPPFSIKSFSNYMKKYASRRKKGW